MSIDEDYRYGDEWDWDQSDPAQYCEHGTFIGSWWGPDLMCWRCEMGDPDDSPDEKSEPDLDLEL
jgi:hypothetical protein